MSILIIIFVLFVLYTIACVLDGPDLKPFRNKWMVSKRWRYAHYEDAGQKRWVAFHIRRGRWRAEEDLNIIKDKVNILPFLNYYYNTSEWYVSMGWLTLEVYFYTMNCEKHEKLSRKQRKG